MMMTDDDDHDHDDGWSMVFLTFPWRASEGEAEKNLLHLCNRLLITLAKAI